MTQAGGFAAGQGSRARVAAAGLSRSCPAVWPGFPFREPLSHMVEPLCLFSCVLSGKHCWSLQQVLCHQLYELQERLPHLGPWPLLPPVPRECSRRPPLRAPGRWVGGGRRCQASSRWSSSGELQEPCPGAQCPSPPTSAGRGQAWGRAGAGSFR